MKKTPLYIMMLILSIICLLLSLTILVQKTSNNLSIHNVCSAISPKSQCQVVQQSNYGKIFGIDNPWYGIIGFTAIILLIVAQLINPLWIRRMIISLGAIFSGTLTIWFLYVQIYLLKAFCIFCVMLDITSIIMMLPGFILLFQKSENKK
jgi:uncharacterized membrane protein